MSRAIAFACVLAVMVAGCSSSSSDQPTYPPIGSIVVMGDSVASGEGIAYGYKYEHRPVLSTWSKGNPDPTWLGPYPDCHQSGKAYGNLVATSRDANLTMLACTGGGYPAGIVTPEVGLLPSEKTATFGPPQFGDWATQTDLNPAYDAADPDLVLVTLGADDIGFAKIFVYCIAATLAVTPEAVQELKDLEAVKDKSERAKGLDRLFADVTGAYDGYKDLDKLQSALDQKRQQFQAEGTPYPCTAGDPSQFVKTTFTDELPSLARDYTDFVQAIVARGQRDGKVPKVVFTTYYDPMPAPGADLTIAKCPDALGLSAEQFSYLGGLLGQLNDLILLEIPRTGAKVADVTKVMDGHKWCDDDPWAYGMSILLRDKNSLAPFHPTPTGQSQIADRVQDTIGP
ncbi:MAG: hypothetical protein QOD63_1190 [Actinomycetota bacterium]|nr:hypothetical protein [Actinomycetota bacterium]